MVRVTPHGGARTAGGRDDRRAELAAFLHYGYRPVVPAGYRERPWSRVRARDLLAVDSLDREDLVRRAVEAFEVACTPVPDTLHVVPLSAGIDSRLLLGTLIELVPRERILTVTFGVPGSFDFDLAPAVARLAGVRHEAIDLRGLAVTREDLLATAREAPWTFVHEAHANHLIPRRHGEGATLWSGCMANSFAGADLAVPATSMEQARNEFARRTRVPRALALTPPDFDPTSVLPGRPLLEDSALTLYEQLFAFLRYPGFNEPILLAPGYSWRTPFREPAWVDFMLRIPRWIRRDGSFYRAIAQACAPDLFTLPTKNDLGLRPGVSRLRRTLRRARFKVERSLRRTFLGRSFGRDRSLNYADFDRELREPSPLREVTEDSLQRLAALGLVDWLDPLELWTRHQHHRTNLGVPLILLSALELNLAAASSPDPLPAQPVSAAPRSG
jgi:hypothetical protein